MATQPRRPIAAAVRGRPRGRTLLALAVAVPAAVAIAVADGYATDRTVGLLGLLAVLPFVVASFSGALGTLLGGVVAGATAATMADYDHARWTHETLGILAGIAVSTLVAAVTAGARRRRVRQLRRIESVADVVQQTVLRPVPSLVETVAVAAKYASATRGAQVGGDVFEVLSTPFGLRVFVGDVRGKGLPALHLANAALGAFREWSHQASTLTELAARLDASVARNADAEEFVTGVLVEVGAEDITLVNCGHPAPLLLDGDGDGVAALAPPGASLPFGLGVTPIPHRAAFVPGDRLALYTDGVSDARRRGRFFDVAAEFAGCADDQDVEACVQRLHRRLVKFTRRRLNDDVAILLLERVGRPPTLDVMRTAADITPRQSTSGSVPAS